MLIPATRREVFAPHLNRTVVLGGRRRSRVPRRALRLARYLATNLVVPGNVDYSPNALASLKSIYKNDTLGDCVIACGWHARGVWTGNADGGSPVVATDQEIITDYSDIGGYNPNDPSTDQGCDIGSALTHWSTIGFSDGSKLAGYLAINPTNVTEVQQCLYLFENAICGAELPDAWTNPFPSGDGFVWDVAGNPDANDGHCWLGMGYSTQGIKICTWGLLGTLTYAGLAEYCAANAGGDLYVAISQDQIAKASAKDPNGLDWAQLVTDFDALGGTVPAPTTPAPTPAPAGPPRLVTLAQAQGWASGGINNGLFIQTKAQAIAAANAGLQANWPTK